MDFWDLVKTLWSRRRVAVPLVVLTAATGAWVGLRAQPDYQAIGHASMVAPTSRDAESVNPWDPQTMAGILVVRMQDNPLVVRRLAAAGLDGEYVVSVEASRDQPLPIVKIEVTAHSPEVARRMVVRLLDIAREAVAVQQEPAQLQPNEMITVAVLSAGENVVEVDTTVIRAVIVVLLAGLILTAGATVGIDAMARRKAARDQAARESMPPPARPGSRSGRPPGPIMPRPTRSPLAVSAGLFLDTGNSTAEAASVDVSEPTVRIPGGTLRVIGSRLPALPSAPSAAGLDDLDHRDLDHRDLDHRDLDQHNFDHDDLDADDSELWFDLTGAPPAAEPRHESSGSGGRPGSRSPVDADDADRDVTIVLPLTSTRRGRRGADGAGPTDSAESSGGCPR